MDMGPLFETIIEHIPAPEGDPEAGTQVLISTIDYNEYVGRIGIGKIDNGTDGICRWYAQAIFRPAKLRLNLAYRYYCNNRCNNRHRPSKQLH